MAEIKKSRESANFELVCQFLKDKVSQNHDLAYPLGLVLHETHTPSKQQKAAEYFAITLLNNKTSIAQAEKARQCLTKYGESYYGELSATAHHELGKMAEEGKGGVERDIIVAAQHFFKVISQVNEARERDAIERLNKLLPGLMELSETDPEASNILGNLHYHGYLGKNGIPTAIKYYVKAFEGEIENAPLQLFKIFFKRGNAEYAKANQEVALKLLTHLIQNQKITKETLELALKDLELPSVQQNLYMRLADTSKNVLMNENDDSSESS